MSIVNELKCCPEAQLDCGVEVKNPDERMFDGCVVCLSELQNESININAELMSQVEKLWTMLTPIMCGDDLLDSEFEGIDDIKDCGDQSPACKEQLLEILQKRRIVANIKKIQSKLTI